MEKGSTRLSDAPGRFGPAAAILLVVAAVILFQAWMVHSRTREGLWYTAYYDRLSNAFRHRQTHLCEQPNPMLFQLADPYDPQQNERYRLHDALFYGGKYYLYNGPAPALALTVVKKLNKRREIGDHYLVFAAAAGLVATAALLLTALRRRLFPELPWWAVLPGVLAAGLAHPVPFLLTRPAIYEASIALAQFALLAGLYGVFLALSGEACRRWQLIAGAAALAAAVATRISLAPMIVVLSLLVVCRLVQMYSWRQKEFRVAVCLFALPLTATAVGLAGYNYVRFGAFLEFGMRYQLAGYNVHAVTSSGVGVFATDFAKLNLSSYLLHPITLTGTHFPFLTVLPTLYPDGKVHGEAVASATWSAPYLWLALLPTLLLAGVVYRRQNDRTRFANWFSLCLLTAGVCGMAPAVFVDGCLNRYLGDGVPALLVLATLGGLEAWRRLAIIQFPARAFLGLAASAAAATVTIGVLIGFCRQTGWIW